MCTEDWRAVCIFGINLDSAGWKSVKIWCKEQIASSKESKIFEGGCKRHRVNEAKSVSDMPCVGLNHVLHLTGHKALYSKLSFRSVPNTHTHILTFILLYALTSTTLLLYGHELTDCVRATAISMTLNYIFPSLLPLAFSFIIIKVRVMSQSLREVTLCLYTVRGPVKCSRYLPE